VKINKKTVNVLQDAKESVLKDLKKVVSHFLEFLAFGLKIKAFSIGCILLGIVWLLLPCDKPYHTHLPSTPKAILCFILAYVFYKLLDIIDYFKNK
jgi:hypothetical protein